MRIETERLALRPWQVGDEAALVRHANNRKVWLNLRDRFPHPYTLEHARDWIQRRAGDSDPIPNLAIEHGGEAIGGIGLLPLEDVARFTAEVGYWLGEAYWGRGFAAEALRHFSVYVFESFHFERLEAWVFTTNAASARVLEKAGYEHEATTRRSVFKDGRFLDCYLYTRFRPR
ncbi:MAG TPA: GNAT family N-acetyltransferase [Thermoanaerobaculia bacterium]|jgi:RimJ/RimL family protein N-acetyltransferase|nr:GNAT family N-acetyltransferase [Thermoanaerobaculia bacterium]